jgi:hypothetical protein
MRIVANRNPRPARAGRQVRPGVTLLEVLVAIFFTGIGLLALLTLFPLGALSLAQAIQDDRADAVVAGADAMTAAAGKLLPATGEFLYQSLNNQSADPKAAAQLRQGYERLAAIAATIDAQLHDLAPNVTAPHPKRLLRRLMIEIRSIREAAEAMVRLLRLLEPAQPGSDL